MTKTSEIGEFIRGRLGRTSSKLVQSFTNFLAKTDADFEQLNGFEKGFKYEQWIQTVKQSPNRIKKTQEAIDLAKLYRTIENLTKALDAEKEKNGRLGDRVKQLEKENAKLLTIKNNYISPPAHVLRAMAVFGE
jgi:hypothetical protein